MSCTMTNGAGEGVVCNMRLSDDTCDNTMLHDVGSHQNYHQLDSFLQPPPNCGSSDPDYASVEFLLQHLGCELKVVPDTDIVNYYDNRNAAQLLDDLSEYDSRLEVIQEENGVDAELLLDDLSGCDSRLEVIQEENSVDAEFSEPSEDEDQLCLALFAMR